MQIPKLKHLHSSDTYVCIYTYTDEFIPKTTDRERKRERERYIYIYVYTYMLLSIYICTYTYVHTLVHNIIYVFYAYILT